MSGSSPPSGRSRRLPALLALLALIVVAAAVGLRLARSGGDSPAGSAAGGPRTEQARRAPSPTAAPAALQELAERFRPVLWTTADDYQPADIRILLEAGADGGTTAALVPNPAAGQPPADGLTLARLCAATDPAVYLDLRDGKPRQAATATLDQTEYRARAAALAGRYPPTVYARVAATGPDTVIQYWLFYLVNDWANNHEGDWEFVTLLFPSATPTLVWQEQRTPSLVAYSQHQGGSRRAWQAVERWQDTERPVVYVGAGSHANHFRRGGYRYATLAAVGAPAVEEAGGGPLTDYALQMLPGAPARTGPCDAAAAVVRFGGRWGEPAWEECSLGCDGPPGPARHRAWLDPVTWLTALPEDAGRWPACAAVADPTRIDCYLPPSMPGASPAAPSPSPRGSA